LFFRDSTIFTLRSLERVALASQARGTSEIQDICPEPDSAKGEKNVISFVGAVINHLTCHCHSPNICHLQQSTYWIIMFIRFSENVQDLQKPAVFPNQPTVRLFEDICISNGTLKQL
jgi:hypothetical protein